MPIKDFKEIFVWQKAHELVLVVYGLTKQYPKEELFGLVSQSRRAIVSVPSNIVEGFKRSGDVEDLRFCNVAQASLKEVKYQIYLAKDLGYVSLKDYDKFNILAEEVSELLHLWVKAKK